MKHCIAVILCLVFLIPCFAHADDNAEHEGVIIETIEETSKVSEPYTYSPDHCEFTITFPEEPSIRRECEDPETQEKCYDQVDYTQVYELASTVKIRTVCNEITEPVRERFTKEVMEATLNAMTADSVVKKFDSSSTETDHYRYAGLVGEGLTGITPTIYTAQLWIGKSSAFSLEAELIGESYEKADQLFGDILRSVQHKDEE